MRAEQTSRAALARTYSVSSEGSENEDEGRHEARTRDPERGRGGPEAVLVFFRDGPALVVHVVVEDERAEDAPPRARLPRHGVHSGGQQPRTQPRQASGNEFLHFACHHLFPCQGGGRSVLGTDLSRHPFWCIRTSQSHN